MIETDRQAEVQAANNEHCQQVQLLLDEAVDNSVQWAARGFTAAEVKVLDDALIKFRTDLRLARVVREHALAIINEPVNDDFTPKSVLAPHQKPGVLRQGNGAARDSESLG